MSKVEEFYDKQPNFEWERLERHRMEFAVTMRALEEALPPPPGRILDNGGGPGRYAIQLAKLGYDVLLGDISQACLDLARTKADEADAPIQEFLKLDGRKLKGVSSGSLDAVLLMGPLYHLVSEADRRAAVNESRRVLRKGGLVFASFLCRFAGLRDAAQRYPEEIPKRDPKILDRFLRHGVAHGETSQFGFTESWFAHPDEIIPFMEGFGFETIDLIGCEGVAVSAQQEKINALEGEAWEKWVDLNYRLGREPSLWGASDHLLYIGER